MKRPNVLYPTLIRGVIDGPIRCESLDGSEIWLPKKKGILKIPPFERDGKTFCVSHIQKKAKMFRLLYDPFIYHFGQFWRLQQQDKEGNWIPGSEQGIYWRTPGWRFQVPDAKSDWTPWIWSWGRFIGTHLD